MTDSNAKKDLISLKAKKMGQYLVSRTIGKGLFKVKLLYDPDSNSKYAAKICKQKFRKPCLVNEVSHLKDLSVLSHPHIIKFVDFIEVEESSSEKNYQTANKLQDKRNYQHKASMIMELASNGSIFDMLYNNGPFEEKLARTYFRQLVDVIMTLHNEGYVHKDIKPENLLLDENFQLKLGDFGLCERFNPKTGDQMNKKVGTEAYAPPELYADQTYAGTKLDIFALGVTLFLLVIGSPPFFKATASDPYYKYFLQGHPEKFWQAYETKIKMREGFSESLKTLVNDLLVPQANLRPNAEAVLDYAWLQEEVYSDVELVEKMKTKKKSLKCN